MHHEMLTQHALFCIDSNTKEGTLSQQFCSACDMHCHLWFPCHMTVTCHPCLGSLVSEVEMPLPLFFHSVERSTPVVPSVPEREEPLRRAPSLSRRLSFRRRRRETRPSDISSRTTDISSRTSSEVTFAGDKRE